MSASNFKAERTPETLLLRALILSLMIHAAGYGTWQYGEYMGWWRQSILPSWLQFLTPKKNGILIPYVPPTKSKPTPLLFVDVDPTLVAPEPPKNAKFYSAVSTTSASPVQKPDAPLPEINGVQEKVLKTTDDAKPEPKPAESTPEEPVKPEEKVAKAEAKPTLSPGDITKAKPDDKPKESKGTSETDKKEEAKPQVHQRPRTLAEVAKNTMSGEKSKQTGATARMDLHTTLDVAGTSYGGYDKDFIDAIRNNWFEIIQDNSPNRAGETVIEFRLWFDGRITDVHMTENTSGEIPGLYCKQSVLHTNPFRKWPNEMRHELGDFRDIRFTFYYLPP